MSVPSSGLTKVLFDVSKFAVSACIIFSELLDTAYMRSVSITLILTLPKEHMMTDFM